MKYIILFFILFSLPALSDEICKSIDSKIEPDFRWQESDFTKVASQKAIAELSEAIEKNEIMATFQLPNNLSLIEGYILKQEAIRALSGDAVHEGLVEYYVTNFCEFLARTPIYD
ncbi:hypothetical protein [Teredinibacter purpureus]|uniref:hypothetical protein n=1 Tax=Teredinibacter purpureus TaxID=2731756 RepID=UPI0005F77C1E|nr:hypothetical protein [Teredinibacter purpureus]